MDQKAYEKFKTTRQEKLKLRLAVELCLKDEQAGPQDCEAYLRLRQRPAAGYMIREGMVKAMERLVARPWFRRDYLRDYLLQAGEQGSVEMVALLFSMLNGKGRGRAEAPLIPAGEMSRIKDAAVYGKGQPGASDGVTARDEKHNAASGMTDKGMAGRVPENGSVEGMAKRIMELTLQEILQTYPALGGALAALEPVESESMILGTDGECLFYRPDAICLAYRESQSCLLESLLHVICHCLLLHIFLPEQKEGENVLEQQANRQVGDILGRSLSGPLIKDDHSCWPGKHSGKNEEKVKRLSEKWHRLQAGSAGGLFGGHSREKRGMSGVQEYEWKQKKGYDYHRFLTRFMVRREMQQLNMESFDPVWYHYSREHYDGLVFLEPQETMEVTRLSEILIAIDTSASCQGPIVQRFLDETFAILQKQEHFFRQMRVHIVQCDFMVEDYACITCERDWRAYQRNLKIHGLGDTDFCPVFDFARKMSEKGEFHDLKGILYFTDGDGIFPKQAPPWPTAFVFLNDELEKHALPDWAIRLNLHLKV